MEKKDKQNKNEKDRERLKNDIKKNKLKEKEAGRKTETVRGKQLDTQKAN
jgi:hypothetical protein